MEIVHDADGIVLIHGDCLEHDVWTQIVELSGMGTPGEAPAATLVTDPPYGINYVGRTRTRFKEPIANDHDTSARDIILARWLGPAIMFGTWKVKRPEGVRQMLIWDKENVGGMGDSSIPWKPTFEEIYVIGQGFSGHRDPAVLRGETICTWNTGPNARRHPNEKPVQLMQRLIAKCPGVIVDPFAGSGTTLVAARNLGRRAIGVEIDAGHVSTIVSRLAELTLPMDVPVQ